MCVCLCVCVSVCVCELVCRHRYMYVYNKCKGCKDKDLIYMAKDKGCKTRLDQLGNVG